MPCRALLRISTPASAGPTVGANYRGKVTANVGRVGLIMGRLLGGEFEERVDIGTRLGEFTQVRPRRCDKDLLLLYDYRGLDSSIGRADRIDYSDDVSQP